jgi:hypothetical protein
MSLCRFLSLLLLMTLTLAGNHSLADPQSKSFSNWQLGQQTSGTYTIAAREVTRLPAYQSNGNLSEVLIEHLSEKITVKADGRICGTQQISSMRASEGYLKVKLSYLCPNTSETIEIANHALFNVAASHIHFAKFEINTQGIDERLYTRRQLSHQFSLGDNSVTVGQNSLDIFATYIQFGFEHILIGFDHIAFLLTLMLLTSRLRDIIFIVTGFTLGHSITLSLTVLGLATPDSMVVEAFIGFTIAIIAAENIGVATGNHRVIATAAALSLAVATGLSLFAGIGPSALSLFGLSLFSYCYLCLSNSEQRARQLRPGITTLFGLIHGFGFAGVLIEVGLPEHALVPALLGFNAGVELGQITIVCLLGLVGWLVIKQLRKYRMLSTELLSAGLCGLGVYWFIQRLYF